MQVIVFLLGDTEFAVPITQAVRIVRLSPVTRVPRAPHFLAGVINVEGDIIPVIDLKKRFSLPASSYGPKARIIVVETDDQRLGMMVDRVREVYSVPKDAVEPAPAMVADINGVYLRGVVRRENRLLILLDLKNVLTLQEVSALYDLSSDPLLPEGETR